MKKATGKVIKAFRKHLGYTQEFVANEINVTTRTIENIENGKVSADVDKIHKIAKLFVISDGIILDLAKEVMDAKDDSWLASKVKQLRRVYPKEENDELAP